MKRGKWLGVGSHPVTSAGTIRKARGQGAKGQPGLHGENPVSESRKDYSLTDLEYNSLSCAVSIRDLHTCLERDLPCSPQAPPAACDEAAVTTGSRLEPLPILYRPQLLQRQQS